MKDNNFTDSNILIYAHTMQDERKKKIAQAILSSDQTIISSAQALNESINVFIKRFKIHLNNIQDIVDQTFLYIPVKIINNRTILSGLEICNNTNFLITIL